MKRLILNSLILIGVLVSFTSAELPEKVMNIEENKIYSNNNEVILYLENFAKDEHLQKLFLLKENHPKFLRNSTEVTRIEDFSIDTRPGRLTIRFILNNIDRYDNRAEFIAVSDQAVYLMPQLIRVQGKLIESFDQILGENAAYSIIDRDGLLFQTNDTLEITDGSGFDASEGIIYERFREFNGLGQYIGSPGQTIPAGSSVQVDGSGVISGEAQRDGSAFESDAVSIKYYVIGDGESGGVYSTNSLPIEESIRPNLDSAYAFAQDTMRLFFDEPVREVGGDAAGKFGLTPPVSAVSISPVGGDTSATWDLVISGLLDRGLGGLKIVYNSLVGGGELQDPSGNEVMSTGIDSIVVVDGIPPNIVTLRNSANTADLTIGEYIGSTTYNLYARVKDGNSDTSLDSVIFEGSDNGTLWTNIGYDLTTEGDSADFSVSWDISADGKFKILRATAFDNVGNSTESVIVGSTTDGFNDNFEDTYRAVIEKVEPASIGQSSGSLRAAIIVELQNNYGDSVNTLPSSVTFNVSESSTTTEKWWSTSSGGTGVDNSITLTIVTTAGEDTVWYSNGTAGGPYTLVLTETGNDFANNNGVVSADGQTITVTVSNIVTVSNNSPAVDSNIDTTTSAGDLTLQVDVDGEEDGGVGDDFRFVWGFSNSTTPGTYNDTTRSGNLTPPVGGGQISYPIPPADLRNQGGQYIYMYYWLENISTDPNATVLDGFPISSNPARLVCNPHLVTTAGENGADAAQGSFTPGENYQEVVSIKFMSDPTLATIQITSLVFDITATSTADVNDLGTFRLFKDGGVKGTYEALLDQEIATVDYESGTAVNFQGISPVLEIIGVNGAHVLVTVDIKSGANSNHTLGMRLQATDRITMVDNVENGPRTAITKDTFSPLGTSVDYPLPVTLSSFIATAGYGKIVLSWVTSSETNNAGFYVMRAEEEKGIYNQMNIQIIQGYGNTTMEHHYRYEDTNVEIGKIYYYRLYSIDFNGDVFQYPFAESATALALPETFTLEQNFPNPFNPTTRISIAVPQESQVKLEIYNMLGQKVRTLFDDRTEPGVYENIIWDAKDDRGNTLGNGIYYLVMTSSVQNFKQVRKMVFMK